MHATLDLSIVIASASSLNLITLLVVRYVGVLCLLAYLRVCMCMYVNPAAICCMLQWLLIIVYLFDFPFIVLYKFDL